MKLLDTILGRKNSGEAEKEKVVNSPSATILRNAGLTGFGGDDSYWTAYFKGNALPHNAYRLVELAIRNGVDKRYTPEELASAITLTGDKVAGCALPAFGARSDGNSEGWTYQECAKKIFGFPFHWDVDMFKRNHPRVPEAYAELCELVINNGKQSQTVRQFKKH